MPLPGEVDPAWVDDPPACAPDDWLVKYLWYRLRLRGNGTPELPGFVSVGADAGESITASHRDPTSVCAWDWWMNDPDCSDAAFEAW